MNGQEPSLRLDSTSSIEELSDDMCCNVGPLVVVGRHKIS